MNMICGKCLICEEEASGFNVLGNFCRHHKELFVRDWTKQSLEDLLKEFPKESTDVLTKLFQRYATML